MKERPILMSAPMVRAILEGHKTQTRRVVKPQPPEDGGRLIVEPIFPTIIDRRGEEQPGAEIFGVTTEDGEWCLRCSYGAPGDRLWVREAFGISYDGSAIPWTGADEQRDGEVIYRATFDEKPDEGRLPWKPSIHMPRWASRITLEITGVRVERLQDISSSDAIAEGIEKVDELNGTPLWRQYGKEPWNTVSPVESYRTLWEQINGAGSWEENPWAWVIEFKRVMP